MNTHPHLEVMVHSDTPLKACDFQIRRSRSRGFGFIGYFFKCLAIARQRRDLLALNDDALKDIGINRVEAEREAYRGFWDIPHAMK